MRAFLACLLGGMLLTACAPGRLTPLDSEIRPDQEADTGYLLVSVTSSGGRNAHFRLRSVTTGIERSLAAVGTGLSEAGDDFDDDDSLRGRLLLVAVAPGAYEMTNWGLLLTQRDHDRRWLAPAQLPPIGVAVRRGEVVYIGNLHIAATRAEHEILPPLLRPVIAARAVISDQSDRDLTLYRQRYPGFAGWTVRASVKTRPEWSLTIQRSTAGDSTPKPSAPEKSKPDEATPAKSNTG